MIPRFFCSQPMKVGRILELPHEVAHHALRVLRLRLGEAIVLFDGSGGEYRASLQDVGRRARVQIETFEPVDRESPLAVTLAQAGNQVEVRYGDGNGWSRLALQSVDEFPRVPELKGDSHVSLAGYALSRIKFPGSQAVFLSIVGTMMVPGIVMLIPMFIILKAFGMIDSYAGMIVPKIVTAFGIFLMAQFFEAVPIEIEEAARMDGASAWQILWRITLPLLLPWILPVSYTHLTLPTSDLV